MTQSKLKEVQTASGLSELPTAAAGSPRRRILMIDGDPDRMRRRERISILKERGFVVYPALNIEQARNRCRPGAYDLIIVNAGQNEPRARELCDEVRKNDPKQRLLLLTAGDVQPGERSDLGSDSPEFMLERVKALFEPSGHSADVRMAA